MHKMEIVMVMVFSENCGGTGTQGQQLDSNLHHPHKHHNLAFHKNVQTKYATNVH